MSVVHTTTTTTSRTAYLSKLRRAFLLRVHPDRFRHYRYNNGDHNDDNNACNSTVPPTTTTKINNNNNNNNNNSMTNEMIQLQQASLVKALADRMNQPDFTAWLQQRDTAKTGVMASGHNNNHNNIPYQYVIEKRDGSLLQTTLSLNRSVDDILKSMANALQKSGAGGSIPTLPYEQPQQQPSSSLQKDRPHDRRSSSFPFRTDHGEDNVAMASMTFMTKSDGNIDTRYDVRSNKGRDLKLFLQQKGQPHTSTTTTTTGSLSLQDQICELRNARMDAISVALQVRRTFQFAAIDATETGWSSASVTVLFRRLLTFHEEYANKLHVQSFYPIRLIFSPLDIPDDRKLSSLDVYGGIIRLNPASTSIQWLETLQYVTADTIQKLHHHRAMALQYTKSIQRQLNIKISKGFTCSSHDYHYFLERIATEAAMNEKVSGSAADQTTGHQQEQQQISHTSSSLTVEPLHAVVEADTVCRRAVVTSAGIIRLGTGMSNDDCRNAIHRLSFTAREQAVLEQTYLQQCNDIVSNIKWQLGLQRVYRTTGGVVSHAEFMHCLTRFIRIVVSSQQQSEEQLLFQPFTGNALGISPTGQSCQLADDGSVVIPLNWTYM